MLSFLSDVRQSLRMLTKRPGFTLTAIGTLALGIGATTAIFSAVHHVLISPLPFRDSHRMGYVWQTSTSTGFMLSPPRPVADAWLERATLFDGIALFETAEFVQSGQSAPEIVRGGVLSADVFGMLGVQPVPGRAFTTEEARADAAVAARDHTGHPGRHPGHDRAALATRAGAGAMTRSPARALLIDDEILARQRLRTLLEDEPRIEIVGEAAGGRAAVERILELAPDLIFLDVQMPGLDGFEVLRALAPAQLPLVIFVTAHDEHAIQGFEVNAVDYLLKPVIEERFRAAVDRVLERYQQRPQDLEARLLAVLDQLQRAEQQDRIPVHSGDGIVFVRTQDLDWAEVAGDYVKLHTGNTTHLLRQTMTELERRLPPTQFLRIHRSTLVNLSRVAQVQPWSKGDFLLILHDGTRLVSGRTYRERLHQLLR
ncbi:MAG: LytTR family transcriptional regulator DNA-binding domain-containing protein [Longimicrobiales bacterium]